VLQRKNEKKKNEKKEMKGSHSLKQNCSSEKTKLRTNRKKRKNTNNNT